MQCQVPDTLRRPSSVPVFQRRAKPFIAVANAQSHRRIRCCFRRIRISVRWQRISFELKRRPISITVSILVVTIERRIHRNRGFNLVFSRQLSFGILLRQLLVFVVWRLRILIVWQLQRLFFVFFQRRCLIFRGLVGLRVPWSGFGAQPLVRFPGRSILASAIHHRHSACRQIRSTCDSHQLHCVVGEKDLG